MIILELNQTKKINNFEINFSKLFKSKKVNTNQNISIHKKISLLKSKSHATKLHIKLVEINKFVNANFAQKFLNGFLEYRGLTFNEYLNSQN